MKHLKNPRKLSILISALALLALMAEASVNDKFLHMFFYLPFYGYPMLVAMFLSVCSEKPKSQGLLAAGSVVFAAWYFFALSGVVKILQDPSKEHGYIAEVVNNQNYVFIGLYALPFLVIIWGVVGWFERRERPGFYKKPKNEG